MKIRLCEHHLLALLEREAASMLDEFFMPTSQIGPKATTVGTAPSFLTSLGDLTLIRQPQTAFLCPHLQQRIPVKTHIPHVLPDEWGTVVGVGWAQQGSYSKLMSRLVRELSGEHRSHLKHCHMQS